MVETWHWFGPAANSGYYNALITDWRYGGIYGWWISATAAQACNSSGIMTVTGDNFQPLFYTSVRYVKI